MTRYINLRGTLLLLWSLLLLNLTSCIDPFEPEVDSVNVNFLVVDGFINASGVTTIKLTRTLNLQASTTPPVESKATVYIEEENGQRYRLTESPAGTYTSPNLQLSAGKRHRLHFTTAASKEYFSDYTAVKITPPIDAVSWKIENDEVKVLVSTHDAASATRFYRWDCEETWEFTSAFRSVFELVNKTMQKRQVDIYRCWITEKAGAIRLGTTNRLSEDVVAQAPLLNIPNNSNKLVRKYSVLVRQYAQTAEEFAYWEALRKNTENIGTLFDALPTQLSGNVHSATNSSEPVLGFVGAYSVTEKRLFISNDQLPATWRPVTGYERCTRPDTIMPKDAPHIFQSTGFLPVEALYNDAGIIWAYTGTTATCVDCRLRGTNVEPAFWK